MHTHPDVKIYLDGPVGPPHLAATNALLSAALLDRREAAPPLQLQVHNACITPPNQKLDPKTLSETNANPKKVVSYLVQDPRVLTIA